MATELDKKSEAVQVAMLHIVIWEEARDVLSTFTDWAEEGEAIRIELVLMKFPHYCQPCKMCHLRGSVLTAAHKSRGKRMTNTAQL